MNAEGEEPMGGASKLVGGGKLFEIEREPVRGEKPVGEGELVRGSILI